MTARPQEPARSEQWLESEHWSDEPASSEQWLESEHWSEEDHPPTRRPRTTQPPPATARRLVTALLRSPAGLRQVIVAKEILDPPVALRRRRAGAWRR